VNWSGARDFELQRDTDEGPGLPSIVDLVSAETHGPCQDIFSKLNLPSSQNPKQDDSLTLLVASKGGRQRLSGIPLSPLSPPIPPAQLTLIRGTPRLDIGINGLGGFKDIRWAGYKTGSRRTF
jgi:hypothetical protein